MKRPPDNDGRRLNWNATHPFGGPLDAKRPRDRPIAGGCRRDQWLALARLREAEHPDDALPIWQEEVDREIAAAGRGEKFVPYVAGVREAHRRKRNLMKLFAERGW